MFVGGINRLNANNAAYNWMCAADSRRDLAFNGCCGGDPVSRLSADKNLMLQMLKDRFKYQAYSAMEDSEKRATDENIKRSFSISA